MWVFHDRKMKPRSGGVAFSWRNTTDREIPKILREKKKDGQIDIFLSFYSDGNSPSAHTEKLFSNFPVSVLYFRVVYSPSVSSSASCKQILLIRCTQPRRLNSTIDIPTYYTGSIYYDMSCMYSTIHIRSSFIYIHKGRHQPEWFTSRRSNNIAQSQLYGWVQGENKKV